MLCWRECIFSSASHESGGKIRGCESWSTSVRWGSGGNECWVPPARWCVLVTHKYCCVSTKKHPSTPNTLGGECAWSRNYYHNNGHHVHPPQTWMTSVSTLRCRQAFKSTMWPTLSNDESTRFKSWRVQSSRESMTAFSSVQDHSNRMIWIGGFMDTNRLERNKEAGAPSSLHPY